MTWLNRGFKIRHKFIKEKDMKQEAIRALELFKQQHLAKPASFDTQDSYGEIPNEVTITNGQADILSESPQPTKENQMSFEIRESEKEQKQKTSNYPDHIAPLKQRIMSALNNGARTVESVARYCKEGEKLINLQLNRWVSRGMIGKHIVPSSGNVKYYPYEIAKEMGILTEPKPINYWTKERREKAEGKKRSSSSAVQKALEMHKPRTESSPLEGKDYVSFLEKRIVEWQNEARKLASQVTELENQVIRAKADVVEARKTREVTSEVTEVMKEVMELRATVAYLESKLFGRK